MSRRSRRQAARASAAGPAKPNSWHGVYEAAERADFRGWFYLPSLNPKEQMDSYSRRTIMERSDWLYKNVGAISMVIDGLALDEVGTGLWPKWTTSSEEFNKSITDGFHYSNHDPALFSADGHNDFYSAQFCIRRCIRLYGDCFGQEIVSLPETGLPAINIIPGWRVQNGVSDLDGVLRRDGVGTNDLGRATSYRVLLDAQSNSFTDVAASEMLHFHDPFLPGQVRGMPALASVAKRLFRREDILKMVANGTLARERMGFALETAPNSPLGAPQNIFGAQGEVETRENDDGSKYTVQKIFGYKSGDEITIPNMPPGATIKLLESSRPGSPVMEFLDSILREVAWTTLYPAEYVFFLAGMGQGTAVRFVLQKVKAVINSKRQFQLNPQFIQRWALFWAWQRIKAGRFPNAPRDWAKHKILSPADMTVDLGREGNLYNERVATNKMSIESFHGLAGEDAADVEDENLAIVARRMKKLEALNKTSGGSFQYFDIWPRSANAQPPPLALPPPESSFA